MSSVSTHVALPCLEVARGDGCSLRCTRAYKHTYVDATILAENVCMGFGEKREKAACLSVKKLLENHDALRNCDSQTFAASYGDVRAAVVDARHSLAVET